jgi:hypothetical protein
LTWPRPVARGRSSNIPAPLSRMSPSLEHASSKRSDVRQGRGRWAHRPFALCVRIQYYPTASRAGPGVWVGSGCIWSQRAYIPGVSRREYTVNLRCGWVGIRGCLDKADACSRLSRAGRLLQWSLQWMLSGQAYDLSLTCRKPQMPSCSFQPPFRPLYNLYFLPPARRSGLWRYSIKVVLAALPGRRSRRRSCRHSWGSLITIAHCTFRMTWSF